MWKETPTGRREKPGAQKKTSKGHPKSQKTLVSRRNEAGRSQSADRSGEKSSTGKRGGALFKRETEHLCLRPLIHGINQPFSLRNIRNIINIITLNTSCNTSKFTLTPPKL